MQVHREDCCFPLGEKKKTKNEVFSFVFMELFETNSAVPEFVQLVSSAQEVLENDDDLELLCPLQAS